LKRIDKNSRILFTDIEADSYDETLSSNGQISYESAMRKLHAIRHDGKVLVGTDVIRAMYTEVNLGWIYAFTTLPIIRGIIDRIYNVWANYRTDYTRGESIQAILEKKKGEKCSGDRCSARINATY
jgi:predicted DCC family thiol-disulfide oxidoreductase YuxK